MSFYDSRHFPDSLKAEVGLKSVKVGTPVLTVVLKRKFTPIVMAELIYVKSISLLSRIKLGGRHPWDRPRSPVTTNISISFSRRKVMHQLRRRFGNTPVSSFGGLVFILFYFRRV